MFILLVLVAPIQAKVATVVERVKVHGATFEEGKITIVGSGVFKSRMATTEEMKDSEFLIQGLPSMEYTAKGGRVTFVLKPRGEVDIPENSSESQKALLIEFNERCKTRWQRSITLVKELKRGDEVSLSIQGDNEVTFRQGRLIAVSGIGYVVKPKEEVTPSMEEKGSK